MLKCLCGRIRFQGDETFEQKTTYYKERHPIGQNRREAFDDRRLSHFQRRAFGSSTIFSGICGILCKIYLSAVGEYTGKVHVFISGVRRGNFAVSSYYLYIDRAG